MLHSIMNPVFVDLTSKEKIMVTSYTITQQIFNGVHNKGHSSNVNMHFVVA